MFFEQDHGAVVNDATKGGLDAVHRSVLLQEAVELLAPQRGGLFVDATLGLGGHSEVLLGAATNARVLGLDRDRAAIELASARLSRFGGRFRACHANFRDIKRVLEEAGEGGASGVLADLGVSSLQFESGERGFSFRHDAPLDMRMDPTSDDPTAAELLAELPEAEIARIIWEYGEERGSRRIARWIVERRTQGRPVERTGELAELVARAVGFNRHAERTHPATRTFQALRISVNHELENLDAFIETTIDLLQPEGRLVVISFHSLEDRIVKRTLRRLAGGCECDLRRVPICSCGSRRAVEILTKRAIVPTEAEISDNPRARSAKLRACRKLEAI